MEQHFTLTRVMLSADDEPIASTSFTVSDADAVNCAHMLAAGFNTMSRNFIADFALGVVSVKSGTVQYDGKSEKIDRPDPHTVSTTFKFEPSAGDGDTLLSFFTGDGKTAFSAFGKVSVEPEGPYEPTSKYEHIARSVLEAAYVELQDVKSVLYDAGVETIPVDAGVRDLVSLNEQIPALAEDLADARNRVAELERRDEFERSARQAQELDHAEANAAARAELIEYVKRGHRKKVTLEEAVGESRKDLADRFRGMLDVLAKFLVVTGEAEADEGHAVARRLCEIED